MTRGKQLDHLKSFYQHYNLCTVVKFVGPIFSADS